MRRGLAATAAVVLILEAIGIAFINWVMGLAVRHQEMSLAGLEPGAMAIGTWVAGGAFALVLIGCAVVPARIALRDRPPGRFGKILLIVCAVLHGVLGALVVGLVGWPAFAFMMTVLALLVGTLMFSSDEAEEGAGSEDTPPPAAPAAA